MKFIEWMRVEGLTYAQAAERCGLANATVARRYAVLGVIPRPDAMARIAKESGGKVQPNDWYNDVWVTGP